MATFIFGYNLGSNANDGENLFLVMLRYNYGGTKCTVDYIYNKNNTVINSTISNNTNTLTFSDHNNNRISYIKLQIFNIK